MRPWVGMRIKCMHNRRMYIRRRVEQGHLRVHHLPASRHQLRRRPFDSIRFNSIPFHSIPFHSLFHLPNKHTQTVELQQSLCIIRLNLLHKLQCKPQFRTNKIFRLFVSVRGVGVRGRGGVEGVDGWVTGWQLASPIFRYFNVYCGMYVNICLAHDRRLLYSREIFDDQKNCSRCSNFIPHPCTL